MSLICPTKRCRKFRYREEEEYIYVDIKEVNKSELEPAFETSTMIYSYDNQLWVKASNRYAHCTDNKEPMTALEALIHDGVRCSTYFARHMRDYGDESTKEQRNDIILRAEKDMSEYLIVDGVLYTTTQEPMYCIYTFGLGHNHAGIGTSLSIVYYYNGNISNNRYFNALEYEEAVKTALDIAKKRGDTNSFEHIKNTEKIKIFDSKFVTRNPKQEHDNGDKFLNIVESIIEDSKDASEAGLFAMALAITQIKK